MGVKTMKREMDVRVVQCDGRHLDVNGEIISQCDKVTTEFLPDVADSQGGPVLMDVRWLQLRTGGIQQWYFCTAEHLTLWVTGPGAEVLNPGAQSLGTKITRSQV